ncbi:hypothetical protein NIES2135_21090 [Leptolyngbya boryana NIES-2135]|jgi:hypothetical protein|uniref:DOD-type homing endonuclease domain-containing protein n=1 Tax=Leptolyngbya boryana NIES-2135 TaxID=1973484 RepID=A0A1Z4JEW8_LEPBY|nr:MULTISPECIES: hypothetical protein [Leptolyngbya]BAY55286.1 hypothetical protein NIES2135_21090 [Leptolyngbya boryana NIES-2135]MBD2369370.1 hypothetical protein [Leptolyngbya sp. FACHB-161]MBD2375628.1 hypothetical protein [Leptolyngbya sp. FACHB-238]MBD2401699.1 hypothetical protein [Leptolyngbya sp. FACHB-239]MBD2406562.1 hypothetical protein [Leptolyngbya sp. FACHB-402]
MGGKLWEGWEMQVLRDNCGKMSIEEVAALLPHRTVKGVHLRAFKVGLLPDKNYWTEQEDQILRDNFPHKTATQIKRMLSGRTLAAIQKRICEIGVSGERWACKHSANRQFFAQPNILNSYWAGLIAADGCVTDRDDCSTKVLMISLTESDGYLLEQFAKDVEFTGDVAIRKARDRKMADGRRLRARPESVLSISCTQEWFPDLEKHFNITPRKSLTLKPPNNLNLDCSLAYIKGFLDGDGCVHIRKNGRMNFTFCGTLECLSWIKSVCDEVAPQYTDEWRTKKRPLAQLIQKGKIYNYMIGDYRAELLAKEILRLDIPGMRRKWDKVQANFDLKQQRLEELRTPVMVHTFDPSRVYLGRLCKRGHDYQGTGQSLRRVGHGSCVKCGQECQGVKKPMVPVAYWLELTSKLFPDLDGTPYRIGDVCRRGHEYNLSGYGLRYRSSRGCVQCEKQRLGNSED